MMIPEGFRTRKASARTPFRSGMGFGAAVIVTVSKVSGPSGSVEESYTIKSTSPH